MCDHLMLCEFKEAYVKERNQYTYPDALHSHRETRDGNRWECNDSGSDFFKGTVHPEINILSSFAHSRVILNPFGLISSGEHKTRCSLTYK